MSILSSLKCGYEAIVKPQNNWKPDPKICVTLPESGDGFRTYNREQDGVDQVGTQETIDFIVSLGQDWAAAGEAVPFQVGDISRAGGGPFPPHEAHKLGHECDLRPFRKDGEMLPSNWKDQSYDQKVTREWIEMVKAKNSQAVVLFNDPVLIAAGLCQKYKGHDNHLHLRVPQGSNFDGQAPVGC